MKSQHKVSEGLTYQLFITDLKSSLGNSKTRPKPALNRGRLACYLRHMTNSRRPHAHVTWQNHKQDKMPTCCVPCMTH